MVVLNNFHQVIRNTFDRRTLTVPFRIEPFAADDRAKVSGIDQLDPKLTKDDIFGLVNYDQIRKKPDQQAFTVNRLDFDLKLKVGAYGRAAGDNIKHGAGRRREGFGQGRTVSAGDDIGGMVDKFVWLHIQSAPQVYGTPQE